MLHVQGLTKKYGRQTAIENVSFDIHRGEIVGLIGHNGCGKSTTIGVITGYLRADSGSVMIDGMRMEQDKLGIRKKIGYLPEVIPLYTDLTVREQLAFACNLKQIRDKETAIDSACRRADILGVRGRLIGNLSKGYRQRVGLAQAFIGDPPLIILDEPTSGLDPRQVAEMREMLKAVEPNHAILLSSHHLEEVAAICSRTVIMSNGKVVADSSPRELQDRFAKKGVYRITASGAFQAFCETARETFSKISLTESRNDSFTAVVVSDEGYPLESILSVLQKNSQHLLAFEPVMPGMEEVFLELTRDSRYTAGE